MKRKIPKITIVIISSMLVLSLKIQAQDYPVRIPFVPPEQFQSGHPALGEFLINVVKGVHYHIVLQVERAPWDDIGLAGGVPIWLGVSDPYGGQLGPSSSGLWSTTIDFWPRATGTATILFSTLAPFGAAGKLSIRIVP